MVERTVSKEHGFFFRRIYEDHESRYKFAANFVKNKVVLDIACGEGLGTAILAHNAKSVIGVDIVEEVIKEANEKYNPGKRGNIKFICANGMDWLRKNKIKFDSVVSYETVEHIKDYLLFLTLIKKHLKTDGLLILSTPNKEFSDFIMGGTFNPYHIKEFYVQELSEILQKVFGHKPQIFQQRPVEKNHKLLSLIRNFLFSEKSLIVKENKQTIGLDTIYVVRK